MEIQINHWARFTIYVFLFSKYDAICITGKFVRKLGKEIRLESFVSSFSKCFSYRFELILFSFQLLSFAVKAFTGLPG